MGLNFGKLIGLAPKELVDKLLSNINVQQDPSLKTGSNVYEGIKIYTNRLAEYGDVNLVLAGFFIDICKYETRVLIHDTENTGNPYFIFPGNKWESFMLIPKYKDWIESIGGDYEKVSVNYTILYSDFDTNLKYLFKLPTKFEKMVLEYKRQIKVLKCKFKKWRNK